MLEKQVDNQIHFQTKSIELLSNGNILRETNSNALNDNLKIIIKLMQINSELQEQQLKLCKERLELDRQNFELKQLKYKLLKKNSS